MKLKLKLNASEIKVLNAYLMLTLARQDVEFLRRSPVDYLICSVLKGLYDRTNAKVEDLRCFPRSADMVYRLSISQTEGLAIASSLPNETFDFELVDLVKGGYEEQVIRHVYNEIHKTYLI